MSAPSSSQRPLMFFIFRLLVTACSCIQTSTANLCLPDLRRDMACVLDSSSAASGGCLDFTFQHAIDDYQYVDHTGVWSCLVFAFDAAVQFTNLLGGSRRHASSIYNPTCRHKLVTASPAIHPILEERKCYHQIKHCAWAWEYTIVLAFVLALAQPAPRMRVASRNPNPVYGIPQTLSDCKKTPVPWHCKVARNGATLMLATRLHIDDLTTSVRRMRQSSHHQQLNKTCLRLSTRNAG